MIKWIPIGEPPSDGREVVITNRQYLHVAVFMDNEWLWCEPSENIAFGTVYRFLPCPVPPTHWCELSELNLPEVSE